MTHDCIMTHIVTLDIVKYDPNKNYKRVRTIKIGPNRIKVIGNVD